MLNIVILLLAHLRKTSGRYDFFFNYLLKHVFKNVKCEKTYSQFIELCDEILLSDPRYGILIQQQKAHWT